MFILTLFIVENTSNVQWDDDYNTVMLTSPTEEESKEVMTRLTIEHQTEKLWKVLIFSSSPNSLLVVFRDINNCLVKGVEIFNTPLNSDCVSELSRVLESNKTIETLNLNSSPLPPDHLHLITNALLVNTTLKTLSLYGDVTITDKDIPHICFIVFVNNSLEQLYIYNCRNISDIGRQNISKVLANNKSSTKVNIDGIFYHHCDL